MCQVWLALPEGVAQIAATRRSSTTSPTPHTCAAALAVVRPIREFHATVRAVHPVTPTKARSHSVPNYHTLAVCAPI